MARTKTFRALAEQTGLKYGDIRSAVTTVRAKPSAMHQAYELHARGGYLTLSHFRPAQTREGVRARPWGRSQLFRGAFIVRKLPPLVFRREGRARFPIRPLYGPAIPKEMIRGASAEAFDQVVRTELPARLAHEIDFALQELSGGMRR
jgi:hypothetical protein